MTRTTILLNDDLLLKVKHQARIRGVTITEVVREALEASLKRQPRTPVPSFTAVGKSGRRSIAKSAEKILRRKADQREGW